MDRSVTPWRVLDAEAETAPAGTGRAERTGSGETTPWRTWPVLGGLAIALGLVGVAAAVVMSGPSPVATIETDQAAAAATGGGGAASPSAAPATTIVVHVAGAVRRPGLVTLSDGARVADAIDAAGGLGPRVDPARLSAELNLAARVADGERVVVPSRDDPTPVAVGGGPGPAAGGAAASGPVDLNRATASELDALPGIGPATSAKIIAAREEQPFRTVDELLERKVVGKATLAKIRDLVVIR